MGRKLQPRANISFAQCSQQFLHCTHKVTEHIKFTEFCGRCAVHINEIPKYVYISKTATQAMKYLTQLR